MLKGLLVTFNNQRSSAGFNVGKRANCLTVSESVSESVRLRNVELALKLKIHIRDFLCALSYHFNGNIELIFILSSYLNSVKNL